MTRSPPWLACLHIDAGAACPPASPEGRNGLGGLILATVAFAFALRFLSSVAVTVAAAAVVVVVVVVAVTVVGAQSQCALPLVPPQHQAP